MVSLGPQKLNSTNQTIYSGVSTLISQVRQLKGLSAYDHHHITSSADSSWTVLPVEFQQPENNQHL